MIGWYIHRLIQSGIAAINPKVSKFSFNLDGIHTHDVATYLDQLGIAVRGGNHCAAAFMQHFNINGTVRASFYIYNSKEDVDALVAGIEKVKKVLRI